MNKYQMIVKIPNIHCVGCLTRIKVSLIGQGATAVDIDLETHIGKITFDGDEIDSKEYVKVLEKTGYNAELLTVISLD
ncbi:MAG: heavy-metal-associated domain-containing protein [Acholeplasmataceae bacterium]|nr:heavy-metal-associated domain-containing protein [Acholeplasmataceae bacterium]